MDNTTKYNDEHEHDAAAVVHPQVESSQNEPNAPVNGESKDGINTHMNVLETAADTAAAIPKGTIDPVYEAKARVLNNAV
jgi:hypothetical protein